MFPEAPRPEGHRRVRDLSRVGAVKSPSSALCLSLASSPDELYSWRERQSYVQSFDVDRLGEEPSATLGFVDPHLKQAGSGDIVVLITKGVCFPHVGCELPVVVSKLSEHTGRRHEFGIIVEQALQTTDLADGAQCRPIDLAHALGDWIGRREDLCALLVEKEVVVPEVRARHVPVEVLGLNIEGEHVGQYGGQRLRYLG